MGNSGKYGQNRLSQLGFQQQEINQVSTVDYIVWKDKNIYYAQNSFGIVEFSNSNFVIMVQTIINYLSNKGGGKIFFKSGIYDMTHTITIKDHIQLIGSGMEITTLKLANGVNKDMVNGSANWVIIKGFSFDGNGANQISGNGIHANLGASIIEENRIYSINQTAIYVGDRAQGNVLRYLIRIKNNEIHSAGQYGIWLEYKQVDSWVIGNNVGSDIANFRAGGSVARILHNHFNGNPEYNILIGGTSTYLYAHNIFENAKKHSVYAYQLNYYGAFSHSIFSDNLIHGAGSIANKVYSFFRLEGTNAGKGMDVSVLISDNIFQDGENRIKHIVSTNEYANIQVTNNFIPSTVEIPWDILGKATISNNLNDKIDFLRRDVDMDYHDLTKIKNLETIKLFIEEKLVYIDKEGFLRATK